LDLLFGAVVFFLADWFRLLNGHEAMNASSLMSFVRVFFNRLDMYTNGGRLVAHDDEHTA